MRGFTLVELLIVMVLIGVMGGMAVLAMGQMGSSRRAEFEARRLARLLELAEQETSIRGEVVGLELSAGGYRFLQLHGEVWQTLDDALFQARRLAPLSLRLMLDGEVKVLLPQPNFIPLPQIVLTPDGGGSEFRIAIDDNAERFWLDNSASGSLQIASESIVP